MLETHKMCIFRHFSIITYLVFITAIIIPLSHGLWNGLNNFTLTCKFLCLEFYIFGWSAMQCSHWCQSKLFSGHQFAQQCQYLWLTKYATHQKLFAWQYKQYHFLGIHWQWLADLWGGQDSFACLYDVQSSQCLEKSDHSSGTWFDDLDAISWTWFMSLNRGICANCNSELFPINSSDLIPWYSFA